jgi:CO/xanthine dehydrogenase Mo-binding subunit
VGALAGGGLLVSMMLPGCAPPPAIDPSRPRGTFAPNAWIRVTPDDRIVFVFDRTEMGQGAMTGHAQLVAEELAVKPERLTIEVARASRAYDNPAFLLQVTGGSSSTREAWIPIRTAAATAKAMLIAAAAKRWGVPATQCGAENGVVFEKAADHGAGKRATYGELAADAAKEPVPKVTLTPRADFKVIGRSVPRLDQDAKVKGKAVFGIDVRFPGLLSAYVLRPPTLGGTLQGFDATEAKKEIGVVDVVALPTGLAVVAEKYWQALRAAAKLEGHVRWSAGHVALDEDKLGPAYRERVKSTGKAHRDDGNFGQAWDTAPRKLEGLYEMPFLAHATMEPQNATAWVRDGRCEVWAPTQAVGLAVTVVRQITGYADDAITIHQTMIGGGFGRRAAQDFVAEAVQLSLRLRRPVKIVWSREDDTRNDVYRPRATTLARAALDPSKGIEGAVLGYFQRVAVQSILQQSGPEWTPGILPSRLPVSLGGAVGAATGTLFGGGALPDPTTVEGGDDIAYRIANVRVEHAAVSLDVPLGFWRSVGYSHNTFVAESFLDEIAHALGKDPYELRVALLANAPQHKRVLQLAAEKAKWSQALPPGVFRGIAQCKCFGTAVANVVEITMEAGFPKVKRIVVAVDCGLVVNPDIVRAQIESGVVFGLSAALKQAITLRRGHIEEGNFDSYELLRLNEMPLVEVHIVESDEAPKGIGEPGVPCVAPALGNAVFAATGKRVRRLPFTVGLEGLDPRAVPR